MEYRNRLSTLGELLYFLAHPEENPSIPDGQERNVAAAVVDEIVDKVSVDVDKALSLEKNNSSGNAASSQNK